MVGDIPKEKLQKEEIFIEVAKIKYAAELQTRCLNQNNYKSI